MSSKSDFFCFVSGHPSKSEVISKDGPVTIPDCYGLSLKELLSESQPEYAPREEV